MTEPLAGIDLVLVDVETTGWLPAEAAIIEIGAVRLRAGQPAGEFSALVNPGCPIPAEITGLTGITSELARQATPIGVVLPRFLAFASGSVLAAHNAPFDMAFLSAAADRCGLRWPPFAVIDTAALARLVIGSPAGQRAVPDCKLATLAEFFGTAAIPCHRALADARAAAEVLAALLSLLAPAAGAVRYCGGARAPDGRGGGSGHGNRSDQS